MKSVEFRWTLTVAALYSMFVYALGNDCDGYGYQQCEICGLYLAPSTTSRNSDEGSAKWGIFAGVDFPKLSPIGYADVAINVLNMRAHCRSNKLYESEKDFLDKLIDFYLNLLWVPETIGATYELADGKSNAFIPGGGSLAVSVSGLTNAKYCVSSAFLRPLIGEVSGLAHPGRGATSSFYNNVLKATRNIKKGMEIFLDVGEEDEESQDQDKKQQNLSPEDYEKLDEVVEKLISFFEKHKNGMDKETRQLLYDFLFEDVLVLAIGRTKVSKIKAQLPSNPDELSDVLKSGGSLTYGHNLGYEPMEWLQENGLCMDNIRSGVSTISYAGRGAIATRKILKGSLVAPVPLLHIPDIRLFNMYNLTNNDVDGLQSSDVPGRQLLVNYLYGHPDSTLAFLPLGSIAALINHHDEPNAKLVWSKHPNHHPEWMDLDPSELLEAERMSVGLMMEVTAIRDIEPDEEVFIDYGSQWKTAWNSHVSEWNTRLTNGEIPSTWPVKAVDMNRIYSTKVFETEEEKIEPYPDNVELRAFLEASNDEESGREDDPFTWKAETMMADSMFAVTIESREEVELNNRTSDDDMSRYLYTVSWLSNVNKQKIYIRGVPHKAFVFVDKPGTSDQFVTNAFRHHIGIPDEIFPFGPWRNLL